MTQEQKDLLLRDLCARLSYDVRVKAEPEDSGQTIEGPITAVFNDPSDGCWWCEVNNSFSISPEDIKPYLRPFKSMTKEERDDYLALCEFAVERDADDMDRTFFFETFESIDWLNAHHFDYRGLIKQGLAIEVTSENNPYRE